MGDRSNVFIQQRKVDDQWVGIGVYGHGGGPEMQANAISVAKMAGSRLGDPSYYARIVVHNLLNNQADPNSLTGHGLWTVAPDDNEYPILVINAMSGLAWLCGENDYRLDAPESAVPVAQFDVTTLNLVDDDA